MHPELAGRLRTDATWSLAVHDEMMKDEVGKVRWRPSWPSARQPSIVLGFSIN